MINKSAIGLIDSGVGGFTVLKELQEGLGDENFIYLGDSLNMPYGERENEEIIKLVDQNIRFLEEKGVKIIVLACNTASSLIDKLSSNVPLFSIVDAGCQAVLDYQESGPLGLIATRATVKNGAYDKLMPEYNDQIYFISYGTPTLAKVINDHVDEMRILKKNIREAITPILAESEITNLLLGCTHYPIVAETIMEMYPELTLINPAQKEITIIRDYLSKNGLKNDTADPSTTIYITGGRADLERSEKLLGELEIDYKTLERAII